MTIQDKVALIRKIFLFDNLSESELEHIAMVAQEMDYEPHHRIIEQGMAAKAAYVISSGSAKVYILSPDGKEIPLNVLREGDIFGEMALLDGEPRSATVESLTHMHTLRIPKEPLFDLFRSHTDITFKLLATLSKRIRTSDSTIEVLHTDNLTSRTLHILTTLKSSFKTSDIPLTHEELALLTGITRPRLTEALHSLEKEGKIILSHKNIRII
ncbi:Crp/Fnr family transcriptional regulator [Candidatus Woesebacteria bacterium]|nr:Crp/Fnr family transcriptional regulator [Candidatus Woesebacteria bacterium]